MQAEEMGVPFETLLANITDDEVKQGLLQSLEQTPPSSVACSPDCSARAPT